jgi:hypothetical protein
MKGLRRMERKEQCVSEKMAEIACMCSTSSTKVLIFRAEMNVVSIFLKHRRIFDISGCI